MGKRRVPSLPDLPTIAEQGFADLDKAGWFAVVAPKRLPAAQFVKTEKDRCAQLVKKAGITME